MTWLVIAIAANACIVVAIVAYLVYRTIAVRELVDNVAPVEVEEPRIIDLVDDDREPQPDRPAPPPPPVEDESAKDESAEGESAEGESAEDTTGSGIETNDSVDDDDDDEDYIDGDSTDEEGYSDGDYSDDGDYESSDDDAPPRRIEVVVPDLHARNQYRPVRPIRGPSLIDDDDDSIPRRPGPLPSIQSPGEQEFYRSLRLWP